MPDALALVLLACAAALTAWLGRHWLFFHDEWGFVFYHRSGGLSAFISPVNGHLFAGVLAIYRVLFASVGLRHYGAYRAVEIALNVLCAGLVYVYLRRRGLQPGLALVVFAPIAFLGTSWAVLFWLASAGFVIPIIAMVATLLVWDSDVRAPNAITFVLAAVALGSYGLGVATVVGLCVAAMGKGRNRRRLVALVLPLAGWVVWFFASNHLSSPASLREIPGASKSGDVGAPLEVGAHLSQLPAWVVHAATGAMRALGGQTTWTALGIVLGVVLVLGAIWAWRSGVLDLWRFGGIAVALVCFWVLTGLVRVQKASPAASRYLYPEVVLVLLLAGECLLEVHLRRPLLIALAALVALSVWANVDALRDEANLTAATFAHERVVLSELESCRGRVPPTVVVLQGVVAGPFWAATAALGDPVPPYPPDRDPLCPYPSSPLPRAGNRPLSAKARSRTGSVN